ncbi:RNA polymerase II transcription elongation factor-domain-containing protein [Xylaria sp. CBS 124048]|nr:RNA polymerase II transcription elongation factor-domain-containing protein [Xylaria sp. CBS 124048]
MAAAGILDPTKVGKYRVVLSDALLGKDSKELYTGIRYNHKPALSSSTAPHQARIKPTSSTGASAPSYDLSFQDDGGRYAYQGTRTHEQSQYVLIFDPEKEVFVLHRVDSMFNMNLIRTPTNDDADDLRQEYPHLETNQSPGTGKTKNGVFSTKLSKPTKPKKPTAAKGSKATTVVTNAEPPKPAPAAKPKKVQHHDYEDESSDDDILTIENPGGVAPKRNRDFSPGFIDKPRRFSEFFQQQNDENEEMDNMEIEVEALNDADGEEEEEEEEQEEEDDDDDDASENFKLPSPIHRQMMSQNINGGGRYSSFNNNNNNNSNNNSNNNNNNNNNTQSAQVEEESDEDEDMVDAAEAAAQDDIGAVDLEAELMAELEKEESDVSEEE